VLHVGPTHPLSRHDGKERSTNHAGAECCRDHYGVRGCESGLSWTTTTSGPAKVQAAVDALRQAKPY